MQERVYESTSESRKRWALDFYNVFVAPLLIPFRYRELLLVILRRELTVRFVNSLFGQAWAVMAPLVMLGIYMATFSAAFAQAAGFQAPDALSVFAGLIVFNLAMEILGRGPLLMHEHLAFIKRSLFPSALLGWIAVLRALVYAGVASAVLVVALLLFRHAVPLTALFLPFIIVPLTLFLVGLALGLAAIGAFTRDLAYLVVSFSPILIFVTPVFYTVQQLPANVRMLAYLNPLTPVVEMVRDTMVFGLMPSPWLYGVSALGALLVFAGGNVIFSRYKDVLVDVI